MKWIEDMKRKLARKWLKDDLDLLESRILRLNQDKIDLMESHNEEKGALVRERDTLKADLKRQCDHTEKLVREHEEFRKSVEDADDLRNQMLRVYIESERLDHTDDILNVFATVAEDHPLLIAIRRLAQHTYEEANETAEMPEIANSPGEIAHASGGAHWLKLFNARVRDAWVQSRTFKKREVKEESA